jgi:hypothetical protein
MGDDIDGTKRLWSNTYCSLHMSIADSLAESPPVSAQAAAKVCRRLICTPSLHLVVARLLRLALGTCQDTLVLFIQLCHGHLLRCLILSNLLLRHAIWSLRPHLPGCQRLEILGFHLFEQIWVVFDIEEDTHQTMLVPPTERWVFPRRLFVFVPVFVQKPLSFSVCHCPVVHRELCIPWLDAFSRIQLLELPAGVLTKTMFGRHCLG